MFPRSSLSSTLTRQYIVPSSEQQGGGERERKGRREGGREVAEFKERERDWERMPKSAGSSWPVLDVCQVPTSS